MKPKPTGLEKRVASLEEKVGELMLQVFPKRNKYGVHHLLLCEKCGKPVFGAKSEKDRCKCGKRKAKK